MTGKSVVIDYAVEGEKTLLRVSTYYPDSEYDTNKPYVLTILQVNTPGTGGGLVWGAHRGWRAPARNAPTGRVSSGGRWLFHPVSDAWFSKDVSGIVRIGTEFAAESLHHGQGQPCVAGVTRSPDPLEQLLVDHQVPQDIVFGLPEIVESGGLAQDRPDARSQLRLRKGCRHIVSGPTLKTRMAWPVAILLPAKVDTILIRKNDCFT